MSEIFGSDAYAPREVAQRVENVGVVKARLPLLPLALLGGWPGPSSASGRSSSPS